ncbi:MAG: hypothetical protein ACP5N1_00030 [Candidatus Woesearchaeota archaeon]
MKHNTISKLLYITIMSIIISTILVSNVNAIGISVTKAVMDYDNVLRGGYAEDVVYVSTDAAFDVPISYELIGDISDWAKISPDINSPNSTFVVSSSNYQMLRLIITPPSDMPVGVYNGTLRIITGKLNTPEGQYGSQLQAAFMIRVKVTITGTEFLSCNGGGVSISDTEIGNSLEYYMTVSNSGNIRIRPTATIDIWNQDQTQLISTRVVDFNNFEVLPTTTQALSNSFSSNLRIGQYWAYVTIAPCENSFLTTFSVYDTGGLVDTGEFLRLDNIPWAKVGDVVPIVATFKNTGKRTVSAKFKGVITSDNKIIETIDSEFYEIIPGNTTSITVYFIPKELGQYTISGRILYNNKLSFEKSSLLTVNKEDAASFNWLYIIIIIIIIIILLVLLINIRKKKHRMRRL